VKDGEDNVILKIPTIPRIHWILFLLTVFTTLLAGAMMEGARIWESPIEILKGIPFSVTLMLILGTHEFGHYFFAQKHKVDATLPYFIPAPPFLFLFAALIPLSFFSLNWLVWGILILILMRSTKHPPIQDIDAPLSQNNIRVGYACLIIFILCFIPAPFSI
jgi:hypothetical protein